MKRKRVVGKRLGLFFTLSATGLWIEWLNVLCLESRLQSLQNFQCASFQRLDFLPFTSAQSPHYTLMHRRAKPRTFAGGQTFQCSFPHFELLSKNKCFLILRLRFASIIPRERSLNMAATGWELCNSNTRSFTVSIVLLAGCSHCAPQCAFVFPLDGRSDVVAADCKSGTCLFSSSPFNIHVSLAGVARTQCVRMRPIIIKPL